MSPNIYLFVRAIQHEHRLELLRAANLYGGEQGLPDEASTRYEAATAEVLRLWQNKA